MPQDLFIQIRGLGHTLPQVMMSLKSINTMSGGGGVQQASRLAYCYGTLG